MPRLHRWTLHRDSWRLSFRRYRIARGRTLTIVRVGPLVLARYPSPAENGAGLRVTVHEIRGAT